MTPKDLANINYNTRSMLTEYMDRKGMTISSFSREAGCHQNQLWLYLRGGDAKKGLHSSTLQKIGLYIMSNP